MKADEPGSPGNEDLHTMLLSFVSTRAVGRNVVSQHRECNTAFLTSFISFECVKGIDWNVERLQHPICVGLRIVNHADVVLAHVPSPAVGPRYAGGSQQNRKQRTHRT